MYIVLIIIITCSLAIADDPLFKRQWYLMPKNMSKTEGYCVPCLDMDNVWKSYTKGERYVRLLILELEKSDNFKSIMEHPDLKLTDENYKFSTYFEEGWTDPKIVSLKDRRSYPIKGVDDNEDIDRYLAEPDSTYRNASIMPSGADKWHDLAVLGVVGAIHDNNEGIKGITSGLRLRLSFWKLSDNNIFDDIEEFNDKELNQNYSRVINCSFAENRREPEELLKDLKRLYSYGRDTNKAMKLRDNMNAGSFFVFAAGNKGKNIPFEGTKDSLATGPYRNMIVVGAVTHKGTKASYSNFGDFVEIYAPSGGNDREGILTTFYSNEENSKKYYKQLSYTSMAAPFVSSVAALMLSVNPELKPHDVKRILIKTGISFDKDATDKRIFINPESAIKKSIHEIVMQWKLYWERFFDKSLYHLTTHFDYYNHSRFERIKRISGTNITEFIGKDSLVDYKKRMDLLRLQYDSVRIKVQNIQIIEKDFDEEEKLVTLRFKQIYQGTGSSYFADSVVKKITFVLLKNSDGGRWWYVKSEVTEDVLL